MNMWIAALVAITFMGCVIVLFYKYVMNKKEIKREESEDNKRTNVVKSLMTDMRFKSIREQSDSKDAIIKEMNDKINERLEDIERTIDSIKTGLDSLYQGKDKML